MSTTPYVIHVDDSATTLKLVGNSLRLYLGEIELKQFQNGKDVIDFLNSKPPQMPLAILTDYTMPGMSGMDVLTHIKRHGAYHYLPVILLTAEQDEGIRKECARNGAFGYITKPVNEEEFKPLMEKLLRDSHVDTEHRDLLLSFIEEASEHISRSYALIQNFNEEGLKEVYRTFHTLKGTLHTLKFPVLANFIHSGEEVLNSIKAANLYQMPQVKQLLTSICHYLEGQLEHIRKQELCSEIPKEIVQGMAMVKNSVESGWVIEASQNTSPNTNSTKEATDNNIVSNNGIIAKSSSGVRISNDRLDELQTKIKRITQVRFRMSSFANQLKQEFADEAFPNDLVKMVEDLGNNSAEIMEFFISLRVQPATKIKGTALRILNQSSETVGKSASLEFTCEKDLEIDQPVMECLEGALTHLIRNSVDHGLENLEKRKETGKDPVGKVTIDITRPQKDKITVELRDDGGGIDPKKIKASLLKTGVISPESIERMKDKEVLDMIFADGVSTKEEVSDISGRGVGMAAVRESIVKLGGQIDVESILGQGTKFRIQLPRVFQL